MIENPKTYWAELMREIDTWENVEEYDEDAFIEAQIVTVKELLAEAIEIGDVLGEYSFTGRLKKLEETNNE